MFTGTPRQYFELLAPSFEAASPAPCERWVRFGDRVVCIKFASEAHVAALEPAIAHLLTSSVSEPQLTLHVWDATTTGTDALPAPAALPAQSEAEQCEYGFVDERYQFCFAHARDGERYSFLDHKTHNAYFWTPSINTLPAYERAAPFRLLLHWWLRSDESYLIHAGVVGSEDGGVLIGGRGGSGKSTTCLAAASAGLTYLSDDYVAVTVQPSPTAYSLYASAKLNDDSLARFPQFTNHVVNPDRNAGLDEKAIVFLGGDTGTTVAPQLPLVAVVLPTIQNVAEPCLQVARPIQALQGLGPSTLLQMPGTTPAEFQVVAELARALPCYQLVLAPELYCTEKT
ncbi:MAG: hypothetical protein AAF581_19465 [Planctomycetota bacterium]